jgi:hypothetical protein
VEATARESLGELDEAAAVLSSVVAQHPACGPALLRLTTLELSPARVAEESIEHAASLDEAAGRLAADEASMGSNATSARAGWPPLPPLWPFEAILALRKGDADGAASAIDLANPEPPRDLVERLQAFSARDFVAAGLGLRPKRKPGLLLGIMGRVRRLLAGPRSHVVLELVACVPEAWLPVLDAHLATQPEDHRMRLLEAQLHLLDGDFDEALADAETVVRGAGASPIAHIAGRLVVTIRNG